MSFYNKLIRLLNGLFKFCKKKTKIKKFQKKNLQLVCEFINCQNFQLDQNIFMRERMEKIQEIIKILV